jgi:predicted transcriptional regulator
MNSLDVYEHHQKPVQSIYNSRLKIQILLTLISKNASLGWLREVTGSTSQALIPKIRSLEKQNLIEAENYEYRLTPLGRVVAMNVEAFVLLIGGIDQHSTFWAAHDLSGLPEAFLSSIGDLYNSTPKQDTTTDMFSVYSHYLEILKDTAYIHTLSSVASPSLAQVLAEKVTVGIAVELVVNAHVIELLAKEPYASNMKALQVGLTVTDKYLSLGLFKKDDQLYDSSTDLFSQDPHAVVWGENLFRYYKERSTKLEILKILSGE